MFRFVVRRLILSIPILLLVSIMVFGLIHLIPGDPARVILGQEATPEAIAGLRRELGLDRPLVVQYLTWLGNVLRGENIRLVDGGQQRRCFLYVDDAIECLVRILENRDGCADQQIFNVGNPEAEITIAGLARRVIELARGYPGLARAAEAVRCVHVEADRYYGRGYQDMERRKPSIRKARTLLGWSPATDLDTALRKNHLTSSRR